MSNSKTLDPKPGYRNRHTHGLPHRICIIEILYRKLGGYAKYTCLWYPYIPPDDPDERAMVKEGYQGAAIEMVTLPYQERTFHAWKPDDTDFVYFKTIGAVFIWNP